MKQETTFVDTDSEGREGIEEGDIVFEGQSFNVARVKRTSFVKVNTESVIKADESLALSEPSRARLPPLSSSTPPSSSSRSMSFKVKGYNFLDLIKVLSC